MSDSVRLQILKALRTKLKNVAGVKRVSYGFLNPSQATEFPTICMIPLNTPYWPLTNNEYTTGNERNTIDGWPIAVIGYVKTDVGSEKLTDAMEGLIKEIMTAVLADHTLGLSTYVKNCYLINTDLEIDSGENFGTVFVTFAVKYDFNKDSP
jgi:hypothetical protein